MFSTWPEYIHKAKIKTFECLKNELLGDPTSLISSKANWSVLTCQVVVKSNFGLNSEFTMQTMSTKLPGKFLAQAQAFVCAFIWKDCQTSRSTYESSETRSNWSNESRKFLHYHPNCHNVIKEEKKKRFVRHLKTRGKWTCSRWKF